MTLAEFVAGRLDDRETEARVWKALQGDGHQHGTNDGGWLTHAHHAGELPHGHDPDTNFQVPAPAIGEPARVLREVAFRRKLLEGHTGTHRCAWGDYAYDEAENCAMQRQMSAIDSDHPDYDKGWQD